MNYPSSWTTFSSTEGFRALRTTKTNDADELVEFEQTIVNHFTWSCRASLPLVSLFSDCEHDGDRGRKKPWCGYEGPSNHWSLHVIGTTTVKDDSRFFKHNNLVEEVDLDLPVRAGPSPHSDRGDCRGKESWRSQGRRVSTYHLQILAANQEQIKTRDVNDNTGKS